MQREIADFLFCKSCIFRRQVGHFLPGVIRRKHFTNRNHYDVLGVKNDASQEEIRHAFVNLSKMHHPDKSQDPDSGQTFIRILNAYQVLSKVTSRREYDFTLNEVLQRQKVMRSMMYSHHYDTPAQPGSGSMGRSESEDPQVFWDPTLHHMRDRSKDHQYTQSPYYGVHGLRKLPNMYIVFGCMLIIMFGTAIHTLAIHFSSKMTRESLNERDKWLNGIYKQSKMKAQTHGNALQLELLTTRINRNQRESQSADDK